MPWGSGHDIVSVQTKARLLSAGQGSSLHHCQFIEIIHFIYRIGCPRLDGKTSLSQPLDLTLKEFRILERQDAPATLHGKIWSNSCEFRPSRPALGDFAEVAIA